MTVRGNEMFFPDAKARGVAALLGVSALLGLAIVLVQVAGCATARRDGTAEIDAPVPAAAAVERSADAGAITASAVAEAAAPKPPDAAPATGGPSAEAVAALEAIWGVKVLAVRLSAAGQLLDFRYRVLDPEKAAPLFRRKTRPYLVDQASGAKLAVPNPPKVGPLRSMNVPEANRNYFILFSNPGGFVKKGSAVTVVVGDFRAADLLVQ